MPGGKNPVMSKNYAIIGMDLITGLGAGVEENWSHIMQGISGVRPLRRFDEEEYQTGFAGEIPADLYETLLSETEMPGSSLATAMAERVCKGALRQAETHSPAENQCRTGLILATTKAAIDELEYKQANPTSDGPGYYCPAKLAQGLARHLGLTGPVTAISNACASGLIAIVQATTLLRRGHADRMVVVGVDIVSKFVLAGFSCLEALSPIPCLPFDASRQGLSLGEGAGAVVITAGPSPDALAGISGWAITNDAHHITGPSRTGQGVSRAISGALKMANLSPGDLQWANAHGTATVYNDEMEAKAMNRIWGDSVAVTSLKGYMGHTLGAAGVIESVIVTEAMRKGTIPASHGFEKSGVTVAIHVPSKHVRDVAMKHVITLKSGFGGINSAMIFTQQNEL